MSIIIAGSGVCLDASVNSSIARASLAAQRCLDAAGLSVDAVDLLINVGVYRDDNMVEPAMAALIQQSLGMSLDYVLKPSPKATFSLDLMNGACGFLNAIQVASAYLETGSAEYVLVVSSDGHPSMTDVSSFPIRSSGGALLLSRGAQGGFGPVAIHAETSAVDISSSVVEMGKGQPNGRTRMQVNYAADREARALNLAETLVRQYLSQHHVVADKKLGLIAPPLSPTFGSELAQRLGLPQQSLFTPGLPGDTHTSSLPIAIFDAKQSGVWAQFQNVLLISVGAGETAACALYTP